MATMNVSLPAPMKAWVEARMKDGKYSNTSDYVRDLIRDQRRAETIERMQTLVDEGLASGEGTRSMAEIKVDARRRAGLPAAGQRRDMASQREG